MSWTMPHRVLQIVATLIVVAAVSSFTLGVLNAPQRGRLPGEKAAGGAQNAAAPLDATEATPLSQERIEGPPPPPPETEAKADEADNQTDQATNQVEAPAAANATVGDAGNVTALAPPVIGNVLGAGPPPEEPPH